MLAINLDIGDVVLEDSGDVNLVTLDMRPRRKVRYEELSIAGAARGFEMEGGGVGTGVRLCLWLCIVEWTASR